VIPAAAFEPQAVGIHAFRQLLAKTGLRIVNRERNQFLIAQQKSREADGAVLPALDVVNPVFLRDDDFVERGPQNLFFDGPLVFLAQRVLRGRSSRAGGIGLARLRIDRGC